MPAILENTAAMIPAAGNSGRMGIPKALIKLPDGRTFLEQIVTVYFEMGISPVTVVVNPTIFKVLEYCKPAYFSGVSWVINAEPEKGRMLSIALGLKNVESSAYCFVQNIDQPFATADLLQKMMRFADSGNYVAPVHQGRGGHPLLINHAIASFIIQEYKNHESLRDALSGFEKYAFNTDNPGVCENINQPEDYFRVFGVKLKD